MPRITTIGALFARRALQKNELDGEQSPEAVEAELDSMLRDARATIDDLEKKLANVQAKFRGNMTPASKAALDVMGATMKRDLHAAQNASIEIQKRRNGVRSALSRIEQSDGYDEAVADLATLQKHAAVVSSGLVTVTPDVRRRLGHALGVAQLRVAACA